MKIIIVDDEVGAIAIFQSLVLNKPEIDYKPFSSATAALEYAERSDIDVAFLDINMPDIDGIELASRLIKLHKNISIVFITAYTQLEEELKQRFGDNLKAFFYKPYSETELAILLARLAGDRRVKITAFGDFGVTVGGVQVDFGCNKSKEILAYLVDRRAESASMAAVCGAVWENEVYEEPVKRKYQNAVSRLKKTFEQLGVGNVIVKTRNNIGIAVDKVVCDWWDYLNGNRDAFKGDYMMNIQLDFATERCALLNADYE